MNTVFKQYLHKFVFIFFDDILVYSMDFDSHLHRLFLVFDLLRRNQFFIMKIKCEFATPIVNYLGYIITGQVVSIDLMKVEAICSRLTPNFVPTLWEFLGLAGFYRKFVLKYAWIDGSLTSLLCEDDFC